MADIVLDKGALAATLEAGKAIAGGALLTSVRIPHGDGGIVVHLFGDEQTELAAALQAILARRLEFKAPRPKVKDGNA